MAKHPDWRGNLRLTALAGLLAACLLGVFVLQRWRTDPALVLAAVFCFVAVLPNVLITHYSSHQLHYLALHALFIVSFGAALRTGFVGATASVRSASL